MRILLVANVAIKARFAYLRRMATCFAPVTKRRSRFLCFSCLYLLRWYLPLLFLVCRHRRCGWLYRSSLEGSPRLVSMIGGPGLAPWWNLLKEWCCPWAAPPCQRCCLQILGDVDAGTAVALPLLPHDVAQPSPGRAAISAYESLPWTGFLGRDCGTNQRKCESELFRSHHREAGVGKPISSQKLSTNSRESESPVWEAVFISSPSRLASSQLPSNCCEAGRRDVLSMVERWSSPEPCSWSHPLGDQLQRPSSKTSDKLCRREGRRASPPSIWASPATTAQASGADADDETLSLDWNTISAWQGEERAAEEDVLNIGGVVAGPIYDTFSWLGCSADEGRRHLHIAWMAAWNSARILLLKRPVPGDRRRIRRLRQRSPDPEIAQLSPLHNTRAFK